MAVGAKSPTCLFCGAETLVHHKDEETVEPPETLLPFRVSKEEATAAFGKWTSQRFWAPSAIRSSSVDLNALLLPAWVWDGRVETHWAAIVRDTSTKSDKRPQSGSDELRITGLLVPSSKSLRRAELDVLEPFEFGDEVPFDPESSSLPFEFGTLTRRAAQGAAQSAMEHRHQAHLFRAVGAAKLSTSSLFHEVQGRPLLLPIWIGAYRYKDVAYRFVLNGQTGEATGTAPVSWVKVLSAIGIAAATLAGAIFFFGQLN